MLNILPLEVKKKFQREYILRFFVFALIFGALGGAVMAILLIPAYIYGKTELTGLEQKLQVTEAATGVDDVFKIIKETKEKIALFNKSENTKTVPLVIKSLGARTVGIQINSFSLDKESGNIIIKGNAVDRKSLVAFRSAMEALPDFGSVDLPISDLAKSSDISFTLTTSVKK